VGVVITKVARSPQLFKDPECWSGRGLNLRPPVLQSGALPTELTGRRLIISGAVIGYPSGQDIGLVD